MLLLAAGAVLLRLLLFLGRGDYLAFDEGFYLLLGRALVTGDGFSLIGIPHVTLSPLFPMLAGAVGALIGDWVWGGRIVAAVASGLLVLPCWAVFRRLAPERTAFIGCALVAVLPSMAPFVVPFWIGADLWVGAEPVLHVLLFSGVALWLKADEGDGLVSWPLVGAVLALAYLARPEAIIVWGLLGLAALAIAAARRSPRRLAGALLMGVGFAVVAAPYWIYLHDTTGRWTISGRGVRVGAAAAAAGGVEGRTGAAATIERMLWEDDEEYVRRLYSLDPTGLRMANRYWGVYPPAEAERAPPVAPGRDSPAATDTAAGAAQSSGAAAGPRARAEPGAAQEPPSVLRRYARALGMILPLLLWPFVVLGLAQPRSRAVLRRELPVTLSLVGTGVAIAALVAVDPRTQLFLVPLLAFYAARGFSLVEQQVQEHARGADLRPGLVEALLVAVALVWMLGIHGERLYRSLAYGSPHHIVAEQNRAVAEDIDTLFESDAGPVMSWHPALAIFADRDWRVLPFADLGGIIRYADASGAGAVVLSAYYPPDLGVERVGVRYLLLEVPERADGVERWSLQVQPGDSIRAVARLEAIDGDG